MEISQLFLFESCVFHARIHRFYDSDIVILFRKP